MEELKQILQIILDNREMIGPAFMAMASGVIGFFTVISKITPNETDNKWVGYATKIVQIFAVHAKPTEVKKK